MSIGLASQRPVVGPSGFRRVLANAVRTNRGRVGLGLTLIVVAVAFLGPYLPHPSATDFVAPSFTKPGGDAGLLGSDFLGRSVLARLLDGGWQLILSAVIATALAIAVGATVGILAAYQGGWLEVLLMRSADVLLVIPQLVLALVLVSVSGSSQLLIILAVAVSLAPQVARVLYASSHSVCEQDFVKAVQLWGVPRHRVMSSQVLPNLITPLSVECGLRLSASIIMISGLNFLGFGVQSPNPSWGVMINENRIGLAISPWGVVAPTILLAVLAVGTNMFTDAVARANLGALGAESFELTAELPQEQR